MLRFYLHLGRGPESQTKEVQRQQDNKAAPAASLLYPPKRSLRHAGRMDADNAIQRFSLAEWRKAKPLFAGDRAGEKKKPLQIIICKGLISLVRPARFERTAFSSGG